MSYPVYYVPAGDTLPILFHTFDGGTGASITLTGLIAGDVEIYKDGSTTQRASDAGITLLDTDGIDFDGITGIHGFSIDTSDNTDAGFYTVGAWYHVVVSSVTVDGQTVNFIAAAFRITAAENAAGVPDVNVTHWNGTAVTTPPAVNATQISGDSTAADNLEAALDGTGGVTISGNLSGSVGSISGVTFPTNFSDLAITASTGRVTVGTNADKTGYGLSASERTSVADALLDRDMSTGTDSGSATVRTVRQALRAFRNKWSISGGTLTVYKEDDTTASWTATVNTAAGNPVNEIDPADA